MQATVPASWNQLLPGHLPFTPNLHSGVLLTESKPDHNKTKGEPGSRDYVPLTEWEMEAIRRYRTLQSTQGDTNLQCEYMSSTATSGALLQLIVHSKLLPVTNWHDCARVVASWFRGNRPVPLNLLSYTVTQLVMTHQLTPCSAAKWVLDISRTLLTEATALESRGPASVNDWAIAEELERSAYAMQVTGNPLFGNFSSMLLGIIMNELLDSTDNSQLWGLLTLCFLLRRNKDFVLSAWESDNKKHGFCMQRACEKGHELPTHIMAVLTAII